MLALTLDGGCSDVFEHTIRALAKLGCAAAVLLVICLIGGYDKLTQRLRCSCPYTRLLRPYHLIVPGSHEGFGIVYLEAAASGVPSHAARLAGATDAVADGVSGWFVDQPDVAGITAALDDFFSVRVTFDSARCREFARGFLSASVTDAMLAHYPAAAAAAAQPA